MTVDESDDIMVKKSRKIKSARKSVGSMNGVIKEEINGEDDEGEYSWDPDFD